MNVQPKVTSPFQLKQNIQDVYYILGFVINIICEGKVVPAEREFELFGRNLRSKIELITVANP